MTSGDESTWQWGCSKCKGDKDGDSKRELRNCDGETNQNIAWSWAPELRRCPWSQIDALAWEVVDTWRAWKKYKSTPWGLDPLLAPAWWVDAIELCESTQDEVEAHQRKEQHRQLERAQRNGRT